MIIFTIFCAVFISLSGIVISVPPDVCFEPFKHQDCGAPPKPVMYYWKPGSRCERGYWRGCLPNHNMFKDEYECVATCIFSARAMPEDYHTNDQLDYSLEQPVVNYNDIDGDTSSAANETLKVDNGTDTAANKTLKGDNGTTTAANETLKGDNGTATAANETVKLDNGPTTAANETVQDDNGTATADNVTVQDDNGTATADNVTVKDDNETAAGGPEEKEESNATSPTDQTDAGNLVGNCKGNDEKCLKDLFNDVISNLITEEFLTLDDDTLAEVSVGEAADNVKAEFVGVQLKGFKTDNMITEVTYTEADKKLKITWRVNMDMDKEATMTVTAGTTPTPTEGKWKFGATVTGSSIYTTDTDGEHFKLTLPGEDPTVPDDKVEVPNLPKDVFTEAPTEKPLKTLFVDKLSDSAKTIAKEFFKHALEKVMKTLNDYLEKTKKGKVGEEDTFIN